MWYRSLFVLWLAGCAFHPIYEEGAQNNVKIATLPDRYGQILHNELITLFSDKNAPYELRATVAFAENEIALRRDATARRQEVTLAVDFSLVDNDTQKSVYNDTVRLTSGHDVGLDTDSGAISLVTSDKDTRRRLLVNAAHEIRILVAAFLGKKT